MNCILCGNESRDGVRPGLVAWREPVGRDVFTAAPRCVDRKACRIRVEASGDVWEVFEMPLTTRDLIQRDLR